MIFAAEVEAIIYEAQSLKDKRSVVKRIKARIQNDHNVAVSELDFQNLWQRTLLGIVTISNDSVRAEQAIMQTLELIDSFPEIERTRTDFEWY
ncbi:DUF503 domain-containing protein [Thalassobacillus sp. CUG 92003]|uniref:DUF503 domain-containing protein n=1 Tax=Thalassobacillus sp. CUG 92003 TaxID=2736641 RepID=UPI0015E7BE94|nr:DUF503 domain-containing protein [Thalassobacillus sp. CUG 92003]